MIAAAKQRREFRKQLFPHTFEYLNTRSSLRYVAHPRRLKAAAKQMAVVICAAKRRFDLANAGA